MTESQASPSNPSSENPLQERTSRPSANAAALENLIFLQESILSLMVAEATPETLDKAQKILQALQASRPMKSQLP